MSDKQPTLKELILDAIDMHGIECDNKCKIEYDNCYECPIGLKYANKVLDIPDIKKGLELLELWKHRCGRDEKFNDPNYLWIRLPKLMVEKIDKAWK